MQEQENKKDSAAAEQKNTKKAYLQYLVLRFAVLFLASFIFTAVILMGIAFLLNFFAGYHPLPPFAVVPALGFLLAVFMFIPWGKKEKQLQTNFAANAVSLHSSADIRVLHTLENFTLKTIELLQKCQTKNDIYNRITLNLISAGAAEQLALSFSLSDEEYKRILHFAVKTISEKTPASDTEQDKAFYDVLNGKDLEPVHHTLIEFGSTAMKKIIAKVNDDAFAGIETIVPAWRKQVIPVLSSLEKGRDENVNELVFMFTDIVNSTQMARIRGEQISQFVMHTHNAIVRDAIKDWRGREVKTLGDGIFACFVKPADAVNAAIQIQKHIARFNIERPESLFFLRIGLNIGEAIVESGDLFGLPVQITARICDRAGGGTIFVSDDLQNILKGNEGFTFKEEGEFLFKGLNDKKKVYSVVFDKAL